MEKWVMLVEKRFEGMERRVVMVESILEIVGKWIVEELVVMEKCVVMVESILVVILEFYVNFVFLVKCSVEFKLKGSEMNNSLVLY